MSSSKSRSFCITQWNVDRTEADYLQIMEKYSIQFLAYGEEICESTSKPHHQLFMYFVNPKSTKVTNLGRIGDYWGPIHCRVAPMKGSFRQNEAYCSKEGKYNKLGIEPAQGARGDLLECRDMIMRGEATVDDICVSDPLMFHQYGRTLDRLEDIALRKKWRTTMTKGTWLYGPTRTGKSHKAYDMANFDSKTHYVKNLNDKWWEGYTGQPIVIMNEFRGQIAFGELLDLTDKWPKTVKRRGRDPVPFLAQKLIITSSKHPIDIYYNILGNGENMDQLEERFVIKKMEQRWSEGNIGTSDPKSINNFFI